MYLTRFAVPRCADGMRTRTSTSQLVRLLGECSARHLIDHHHIKQEPEQFIVTLFVTAGSSDEAELIGRLTSIDVALGMMRDDNRG